MRLAKAGWKADSMYRTAVYYWLASMVDVRPLRLRSISDFMIECTPADKNERHT
jgi:hypothetical protein